MEKELNAYCRQIRADDLEMIMNWRMQPDITKYMNTDPVLTIEKQKDWFRKIQLLDNQFHWMLEVDGIPCGVASLVDFNGDSVYTGLYIAVKEKRSLKLTMHLQWNFYRYAFGRLGVHKVCEEVFSANKAVNRILDMCGSKREGELRDHVLKNGCYYDVTLRGILREEWEQLEPSIHYNIIRFEEKGGQTCF